MKKILVVLLLFSSFGVSAQETVKLSPDMFTGIQEIQLAQLKGWKFRPGHDVRWAANEQDSAGWQSLRPMDLTKSMADENGRIEGWFRLKVKLDESFGDQQLGIRFFCWAAVDFYIDGKFIQSFGNTGANGKPYQEFNSAQLLPLPVDLKGGNEYVIAFHFVDEVATYPGRYGFKSNQTGLEQFIKLTGPEYPVTFAEFLGQQPFFFAATLAICSVLLLLFLLLALQNKREKFLWLIVLFMAMLSLSIVLSAASYYRLFDYERGKWMDLAESMLGSFRYLLIPILLASIFKQRISWDLKAYLFFTGFGFCLGLIPFYQDLFYLLAGIGCSAYYLFSVRATLKNVKAKIRLAAVFKSLRVFLLMTVIFMPLLYLYGSIVPMLMILALLSVSVYIVFKSWKSTTGAQWAIILGLLLSFIWLVLMLSLSIVNKTTIYQYATLMNAAVMLSFPLSLLIYVALRFKEMLGEVVTLSEEKNQILSSQNETLEKEVSVRTAELHQSMQDLKATQSQLIQAEKMASLGELTAGIAHEIQNPLNFVNNFSDVSAELLDEMSDEIEKGDFEEVKAIASDIKENLTKISHHGKRADAIVKGMLEHSRTASGEKQLTDINVLADKYLRLAYHGLRAKDKNFNADLNTDFDPNVGKVEIVAQDIGRVVLNLLTNAFYAVNDRKKRASHDYKPMVSIGTKNTGNSVEISISDNGNGIPSDIKDKIFQPFFTTKPTGEGTGLGLSLAYDIVKAHGGTLSVKSESGQGCEFTIALPA